MLIIGCWRDKTALHEALVAFNLGLNPYLTYGTDSTVDRALTLYMTKSSSIPSTLCGSLDSDELSLNTEPGVTSENYWM